MEELPNPTNTVLDGDCTRTKLRTSFFSLLKPQPTGGPCPEKFLRYTGRLTLRRPGVGGPARRGLARRDSARSAGTARPASSPVDGAPPGSATRPRTPASPSTP